MNKKVCLISDIHFGVNKNSEMFLNSSIDFFENQLVPYLKNEHITDIFILGDVYDNRNSINVRISDEVYNVFGNILGDFNIIILIGNHDIYYKTSNDVHSLKSLDLFPNVEVIDSITEKTIFGVKTLFCPWVVDYNDQSLYDTLDSSEAEVLFGHFDIIGFALNKTRVSTEGLNAEIFSNFTKVFSGHYHTPSAKQFGGTEIVYIGSPYQMTRNDEGERKGVVILDLKTLNYERYVNNTSIKFISCEYPELPTPEDVVGNIVDAKINIHKKDIIGNVIDKYIKKIEDMKPIDSVNVVMNVISDEVADFNDAVHGRMTSIPDLIELYINNDSDIDNKDEILEEIMNIYEEVS